MVNEIEWWFVDELIEVFFECVLICICWVVRKYLDWIIVVVFVFMLGGLFVMVIVGVVGEKNWDFWCVKE